MSAEIRVPQLGESVVEATVSRWLKKEGEPVAAGETVAELETDKINVEVSADQDGVLSQIQRREGETVGVGDLLGVLSGNGAAHPAAPAAPPEAPAASAPTEAPPGEAPPEEPLVSPMARRLAAENALDLSAVAGSGPGGRVTREDVEAHLKQREEARPAAPAREAGPTVPPLPTPQDRTAQQAVSAERATAPTPGVLAPPEQRPEERLRMSRRRQTIAARLVEAQRTAAMLTTFNEVDMSAVMDLRKRRRDTFKERYGVGLGFMSFFTRAAVGALRAFPFLNAEIQGSEIVVKHYYDIGVAVSTEEGLVVPVVRDADRKTFAEIEREIADLATRAREGKLTLAEIRGGTFTLTNGGVFGSLLSTPILNTPQVGILGMHKIEERPIALKGEVVIRPMMYLALSYDHRIVDGSEAVRFLVRVKELIEDPETLLIEG